MQLNSVCECLAYTRIQNTHMSVIFFFKEWANRTHPYLYNAHTLLFVPDDIVFIDF